MLSSEEFCANVRKASPIGREELHLSVFKRILQIQNFFVLSGKKIIISK
jgi:hypothetical protein